MGDVAIVADDFNRCMESVDIVVGIVVGKRSRRDIIGDQYSANAQ